LKHRIFKTILFAATTLTIQACGMIDSNDSNNPALNGEPPALPNPGTLTIESDEFSATELSNGRDESRFFLSGINFAAAALVVRDAATAAKLAVPAAALASVRGVTPVKTGEKTWEWSSNFSLQSVNWSTQLTGERTGASSATWSFKISRSPADERGCCTGFAWLSGATDSSTSGTWVINDPNSPEDLTPLRVVDWSFISEDAKTLTVTVKKAESGSEWEQEGFVQFALDGGEVQLTIEKDPATSEKIVVNWSKLTKAGSHTRENGTTACWNSNKENVPCS
jgi:hypothetical protein